MLYSVKGELIHLETNMAVICCGGVGFRCRITMNTARRLPKLGAEAMLFTMMDVREDAIELFGFAEKKELECFRQLTSITGVGPKAAIAVLSELSPDQVALHVAAGDHKAFTRAQGVGPKLAQRIVLEMKDKVAALTAGTEGVELPAAIGNVSAVGNAAQAVKALGSLGFSPSEAASAVGKLDETLSVEELIQKALRLLAK